MAHRTSMVNAQQAQLSNKLRELSGGALDSKAKQSAIEFFIALYETNGSECGEGFRHSYSEVLTVMYGGMPPATFEEYEVCTQRAEMLSTNLDQIGQELVNADCSERVLRCFVKLQDHVGLEAQRMTASLFGHAQIAEARNSFNASLEQQEKSLDALRNRHRSVEDDLVHVRNQHITILGIFAAVVLVFNGAIGFSSSAIEAVGYAPSFENIVFIVLIVGLVLINTVALLLGFLWRVAHGNGRLPSFAWLSLVVADVVLVALMCWLAFCR